MRVAILSPYSWTYPGGVTRHIEALAERFIDDGHHVRVLAPYDPPGRYSSVLHRGARPQQVEPPDYLVSLGRTLSLKANQAVSNVSITPYALATAQHELRTGNYDVVHVHEPLAPVALVHHRLDEGSDRRHLPHLQREPAVERDRERAGSPPDAQPSSRPDRGVRGCGLDREAVLWRPLPNHPERRPRRQRARRARRAARANRQAQDRVRRSGGRAQGPAAPAPCVRGAARARPDRADRDRPPRRRSSRR